MKDVHVNKVLHVDYKNRRERFPYAGALIERLLPIGSWYIKTQSQLTKGEFAYWDWIKISKRIKVTVYLNINFGLNY